MSKISNKRVVENYIQEQKNDTGDKFYPNLMLVRSFAFLKNNTPCNILDYACGYGANSIFMLEKSSHLTYADTSPYAIEKTQKKIQGIKSNVPSKGILINPDIDKLPFKDNEFDIITCLSLLSLLSDIETINNLLDEFKRIIKTGGRIYLDINGINSEFAHYAKPLDNNQFEYRGRNKSANPMTVYCPKNEDAFVELISSKFNVLTHGSSGHHLFDYIEEEFIVIAEK